MDEYDKSSIEYIIVQAWKPNLWKYAINNSSEFSIIRQDDLMKLIFSLGVFNKNDLDYSISHHNDFIFKEGEEGKEPEEQEEQESPTGSLEDIVEKYAA